MYKQVKQVVLDSGLWDGQGRSSHGFTLSPSVYEVSQKRRDELETIGTSLRDCLAGISRIATTAANPNSCHGRSWNMITRALRVGVPKIYNDIMWLNPSNVPSICKVDLMESETGKYYIAEVDGHNKHGLGYSTLAARIRRVIAPQAQVFPGVATTLAQEIKRRCENKVILLYADRERFYLPEFRILRAEMANYGIELVVVSEKDVRVSGNKMIINGDDTEQRLFVDLPFLYLNHSLNSLLATRYRHAEVNFLIPPKPFLGSKAVLALLRNDTHDKELETILQSHICPTSLDQIRQHIPTTYLVHKKTKEVVWRDLCNGNPFVLKESVSSGMKGVAFMGEPSFDIMMERACKSFYLFVLQAEVANRSHNFDYFLDGDHLHTGEWFTRITAHYSAGLVADIVVTARQDKKVHGAPDCLQLGTVIATK